MSVYIKTDNYTLYQGKMQEELKQLADNSIDSVICDPPYDLTALHKRWSKETTLGVSEGTQYGRLAKGFMGKTWDGTGIAFNVDTWREVIRVLKPGGHLLAFGGTRTYHRMACAIEDAGFEIRDCIMWLYGSGFPKSHNVGLNVDKLNGVESETIGTKTIKKLPTTGLINYEKEGWRKGGYDIEYSEKHANNEWSGWGTALKPAYEPIIVARKPMNTSVAQNCLTYGVGGINIDECRIYGDSINCHDTKAGTFAGKIQTMPSFKSQDNKLSFGQHEEKADRIEYKQHEGRFPANVITDGSDEVASGMPNTKSQKRDEKYNKTTEYTNTFTPRQSNYRDDNTYNDIGSALRYFYSAKASKKDRDEGLDMFEEKVNCDRNPECYSANVPNNRSSNPRKNIHPTVKPVELMQYLVRLVSPKGAIILDCFMGSGSTGKAVMFENRERNANYHFIGIEMTEEYLPIANARIDYALNKYEYDAKKIEKETGIKPLF